MTTALTSLTLQPQSPRACTYTTWLYTTPWYENRAWNFRENRHCSTRQTLNSAHPLHLLAAHSGYFDGDDDCVAVSSEPDPNCSSFAIRFFDNAKIPNQCYGETLVWCENQNLRLFFVNQGVVKESFILLSVLLHVFFFPLY